MHIYDVAQQLHDAERHKTVDVRLLFFDIYRGNPYVEDVKWKYQAIEAPFGLRIKTAILILKNLGRPSVGARPRVRPN